MEIYVVCPSIGTLEGLTAILRGSRREAEVLVIDEGDEGLRRRNRELLEGLSVRFFGPRERAEWFRARFGDDRYRAVIPERCHAENSFGLLVAYEEGADVIVELDDDVHPAGWDVLDWHVRNLGGGGAWLVEGASWYNTLENLVLDPPVEAYPRGHPYDPSCRTGGYSWRWVEVGRCAFNMGQWLEVPDLDAVTTLYHGGLRGVSRLRSVGMKRSRVVVGEGVFFAACSMNASLRAEAVPAFYQLYMNYMGLDRFDDIWSGVLLKRVCDALGERVCLGAPLVRHLRTPRDVFRDLRRELEGLAINEWLWRAVAGVEVEGSSYYDAYRSLVEGLSRRVGELEGRARRIMEVQLEKMALWLELIDKLV